MLQEKDSVNIDELLAKAKKPAADAMRLHPFYQGKIETALKARVRDFNDFAIWYTPGVAEPCRAIHADPEKVYDYTNKWNTVAVVSDGTRVLGLGDIGPKAGLPVMEGKALLYKYLGGVDGVPIMLDTKDPGKIIDTVLMLQPSLGGVNLEDISQPKCFRILDTLREKAEIPVWHDDQQGTATVTLAGLINALKLVGKKMEDVRITFVGSGASNVACSRLIFGWGADPGNCTMVDSKGILGTHRKDLELRRHEYVDKWRLCQVTNRDGRQGGIPEALEGADVVIALSKPGPGTLQAEWIERMNSDAIRLRQSHSRDLALGGQVGRGSHCGHRAFRLPQPGQQLTRLPGHLPRRAGRAGQDHHRRDVLRCSHGAVRPHRRRSGRRAPLAQHGRLGRLLAGSGRGRHQGG
jgi:malate dehydrogenase (oxaloacetate-decarboxylating)